MRKLKIIALLPALFGGVVALFPCDIAMESKPVTVKGKSKHEVKLLVETIHRRCPLVIDQTGLAPENLAIEKQGAWQKVEDGLYRQDLVVAPKGKGEGKLRVLRECPKRGLLEEILKLAPQAPK